MHTLGHPVSNMFRMVVVSGAALLLLGTMLYASHHVHAQMGIDPVQAVGVSFNLEPPYPSPGDAVKVTARTYSQDMDVATITWTVDGEPVQRTRGENEYRYIAGPVGSEANIHVRFVSPEGKSVSDSIVIRVSDVAIVWEANTYTPPFYHGRALHGPGSAVTLHAIPTIMDGSGDPYPAESLSYLWSINKSAAPVKSGHGLQSVTLTNPNSFMDLAVSVRIKNAAGDLLAAKKVVVPVVEPIVHLYEAHKDTGPRYTQALTNRHYIDTAESVLLAEPYFMNAHSRTVSHLDYAWTIGTQKLTTPGSIILRPEGEGSGLARVSLRITSKEMWQQRAGTDVSVYFDTTNAAPPADDTDTTPL